MTPTRTRIRACVKALFWATAATIPATITILASWWAGGDPGYGH